MGQLAAYEAVRDEVLHLSGIFEHFVDVAFIVEHRGQGAAEYLDDGEAVEAEAVFVLVSVLVPAILSVEPTGTDPVLVGYLLLEQESILEQDEDGEGQEEQIVDSLAEQVDPDDLV